MVVSEASLEILNGKDQFGTLKTSAIARPSMEKIQKHIVELFH